MNLEQSPQEKQEKTTARRITKRTRELIEAQEKQRETLLKQREDLKRDLEEQQSESEKLGGREALGTVVTHKKFGKGTITKEDGKYIEVTFANLKKTFVLPGAIAGGFLVPEDTSLIEYYKRSDAVHSRIQKTQLQLRSNEFATDRVDEQLSKLEGRE